MKHESSACVKGLDDGMARNSIYYCLLPTMNHCNQCHNTQFTNGACVGSPGLLPCFYVYSQSSWKKWQNCQVCPSIQSSARNRTTLTRWIFMEFHIWDYSWTKTGQNYTHFTWYTTYGYDLPVANPNSEDGLTFQLSSH